MQLVLLAADMEGYSNLCQLVTLRNLGTTQFSQNTNSAENDGRPVTLQELADHSRGVIALSPAASPASRITNHFSQLKEIFGDRLYIEVQHLSPGDGRVLREAERIGHELGVPLVATNNVHFLRPEEHLHHRAVNAIRTGGLLTTVAPPEITTGEAWFKPVAEMKRLFPDHPEWLQATLEIADRCNLQLELGKRIFPEFAVPEGETPDSYLEKVSLEGARKRYHSVTPEVHERLMRELGVIKKWSLAPYFLLVLDIVKEARRRGIPAVARGSAASSMVTYCLGISRVRPLREILQAIRALPECRDLPIDDEPWKTILQVALRLDDAPRHLGIHPCGTVISARPLTWLTPLERATKGIVVTQYDMNAIEALGLIKMDLLGQRGFTTMSLALDNIERTLRPVGAGLAPPAADASNVAPDGVTPCPKSREIDFDAIPENDPATCAVIADGRTMGVFQIESPAMRGLLRTMKARTLEEVAQALALIRPGAAEYGSKELFLKRLRKQEEITFAHPELETILGDTLGVCIFQEQVMQISQALGSMSLAEADLVRRASAKFSGRSDRDRLRGKFLTVAGMMGLTSQQREELWMMVEKFAGFGFCKAHAATYADISYRMTYLKTHHPTEFLAAMCSAGAGFYHVSAYVEEAKRWGIAVRLPSVNLSQMEYTVEAGANGARALRIGLMQVKGLRVETIMAILRMREEAGTFRSLE